MLLRKNNYKLLLTLFLVFSNFWIYKIFSQNLFIGILLVVVTVVLLLNQREKVLLVCLGILLFVQYQTTEIKSLTNLDNDEQRVQQERIRSYPLTYIDIFGKVAWLKPEIWIEQNETAIAASRIEENLFENLDLNKYFFAGFPRNENSDFEKFPFIFLPIFISGLINLISKKQYRIIFLTLFVPVILMSVIGNENKLGPFSLFPFFMFILTNGFEFLVKLFTKKS